MPDPRDGKWGKMPHYFPGGGWALLELTDALPLHYSLLHSQVGSQEPLIDFPKIIQCNVDMQHI